MSETAEVNEAVELEYCRSLLAGNVADPDFRHCCDQMTDRLADGETAIKYIPKFREYGIPVLDGGSSVIEIAHCPWCGSPLPGSLRDTWFDTVGDVENPPAEFRTDAWWRGRGL